MSYNQKQEINCGCGKTFDWDIWESVNVTADPDLKESLLNGLLNVVVCPYCGLLFYYERFLLYHDEKKRYLFYVYNHDCADDKQTLMKKAMADCALVKEKSENKQIFTDYKIDVFLGLDELLQFLKEEDG